MLSGNTREQILVQQQNLFFNFYDFSLISNQGFLPSKPPLISLPESSELNIRLNEIIKNLPILLRDKKLRSVIDQLDLTFHDEMVSLEKDNKKQINIALLTLISIAQGYIWEDNDHPQNKIPSVISKNIYHLCKSQQRYPTLTYSDYVLHNWRLIDNKKEISLDNIEPIVTFTGTKDEAWFIKIHVVIESVCSKAILAATQATQLTRELCKNPSKKNSETDKQLILLLSTIEKSIKDAISVLQKMKDNCDPDYFFYHLRPFLSGWEKVKTNSENQSITGVQLEGINTSDKITTHSYKGPSGAQSSIIPALDAFLGIQHEINGMFRTLLEFQEYMPKKHSAFIKLLSKSKISDIAASTESEALKQARKDAIHQVELFRCHHIGLVHQFIFKPAEKIGLKSSDITGTGGTPINHYLGERYLSTKRM